MHTTKRNRFIASVAMLIALPSLVIGASQLTVTAAIKLPLARASMTTGLLAKQLEALGAKELGTVHVKNSAGKELLAQTVDTDGDGRDDHLL